LRKIKEFEQEIRKRTAEECVGKLREAQEEYGEFPGFYNALSNAIIICREVGERGRE